ncbi:MAG: protein kinase [Proteobacteria bacterium]|nr:protein kinase [Pseudomonadota bacterium]
MEPGTMLDGKYRIDRVIRSGGMGTVYEATQVNIGRKVALKLLHPKYRLTAKSLERFNQEARLAGSISHDNICEVTDHGITRDGAPYLVMPLLSGHSLAEKLTAKEPYNIYQWIDIVCQTLSALEAVHEKKIVHRDLKPDNIFITHVGDQDDFVKLLDFGISKVIEQDSARNLTTTGMVLGTAYYLAPELAKGQKKIDHRVDLYAMGVILYEILTGRRPFEGETYNEVLFKIASEPFPPPTSLNPGIPISIEQIILRAMSIDSGERFKDAAEMREALENAMTESPTSGRTSMTGTVPELSTPGSIGTPQSDHLNEISDRRLISARIVLVAAAIILVAIITLILTNSGAPLTNPASRSIKPAVSPSANMATDLESMAEKAEPLSMPEPISAKVTSKTINGDQQDKVPGEAEPVQDETKKKHKTKPALHMLKRNAKKNKKPDEKTQGKELLKGRFGTTFVFDEDD